MSKSTGKRLLETFLDGGIPAIDPPVETVGKIHLPVPEVKNPRQDVPLPANMEKLPVDDRGYRVPYFVSWIDGKPDFRCVFPGAIAKCVRQRLCWICGQPNLSELNGYYSQTYVIGPMCSINHISSEPGSHLECARYAVRVCPFLIAPGMRRNEKDLPENKSDPGGMFIKRNPGAMILWTTNKFRLVSDGGSVLFRIGEPSHLECWREGRHATHAEVMESIRTGLPILQKEADRQGPLAIAQLKKMLAEALDLLERFI